MNAAQTYLAAMLLAVLMPPCTAQTTGGQAPQQSTQQDANRRTQPPAPIVRMPALPKPVAPLSPQMSHPTAVRRTSPTESQTGGEVGTAAVKTPTGRRSTTASGGSTPSGTSSGLVQGTPGPFNRTTVFLDAAHGGVDSGTRINDSTLEKDVVLQFAFKLRSLLVARGFTVELSREADAATVPNSPDAQLTLDARAGMANRTRPAACLLLHATASGRGVHLYASELAPTSGELVGTPWLTAQAPWVQQSVELGRQVGQALTRAEVPLVLSRASIRPVDSLTCPALVVELAPNGSTSASLTDNAYQQRVASAIATALVFWQSNVQPPPRLLPASTMPSAAPSSKASQKGTLP